MSTTAIIIGATGLVGSEILNYALNDSRIGKIKIFNRRSTGIIHPKLTEYIVDFENLKEWRQELQADVLFSALGTTYKQAGSLEAQRLVDYDYQLRVAQAAKIAGVMNYVLVSAPGAHPKSIIGYNRIKGDLERDVLRLSFPKISILRPGLLQGPREKKRTLEGATAKILNILPNIRGLESLRPVSGKLVAHACIEVALDPVQGQRILNPKDVLHFLT